MYATFCIVTGDLIFYYIGQSMCFTTQIWGKSEEPLITILIVLHPCRWQPSPHLQHSRLRQNLRERNDGWTKREAVQRALELEKKTSNGEAWLGLLEEMWGNILTNSWTLFIWLEWWRPRRCWSRLKDKTERWDVELPQHEQDMSMSPHSPSSSPQ